MNEADHASFNGELNEAAEIHQLDGYYGSTEPPVNPIVRDWITFASTAEYRDLKPSQRGPEMVDLVLNKYITSADSDLIFNAIKNRKTELAKRGNQPPDDVPEAAPQTETWSPSGMLTGDEEERERDWRERQHKDN